MAEGILKKKQYPIEWNLEKVKRFFDHYESHPAVENNYFSRQRGRAVLRFVERHISLSGKVLDVGCGPGYFLEYLASAGVQCAGSDISLKSLERASQRLAGVPNFLGVQPITGDLKLPYADQSFEVIFLMETLEHLLPPSDLSLLLEMHRVLKQGGHLVVTTPYNEDLRSNTLFCPFCGCGFHEVQHVASLNENKVIEILSAGGFKNRVCQPVLLWPDWNIWIRAQRQKSDWEPKCPDCGRSFRPQKQSIFRKFFLKLWELRHLVSISSRMEL